MIEIKKDINIKKTLQNENPNKSVNIFEKILDFNKKQKGNGLPRMSASRLLDLAPVSREAKVSDCIHTKIQNKQIKCFKDCQ